MQALADHLSGKSYLKDAGVVAADFDLSGSISLSDGVNLAESIAQKNSSKLILANLDVLSDPTDIVIQTGAQLSLVGVLLGDLDGSYFVNF